MKRILIFMNIHSHKSVATLQASGEDSHENRVQEVNHKRHKFIQNLHAETVKEPSLETAKNFDLIVNTDHIEPGNVVPIVLVAMQQAGIDVHRRKPGPARS